MTQPTTDAATQRLYSGFDALLTEARRAELANARAQILAARDRAWGRKRDGLTQAAEIVAGLLAETERQ